jgi:hypothetical protein
MMFAKYGMGWTPTIGSNKIMLVGMHYKRRCWRTFEVIIPKTNLHG